MIVSCACGASWRAVTFRNFATTSSFETGLSTSPRALPHAESTVPSRNSISTELPAA